MNDENIEQEIQSKGLTAPRITPDDIEANITAEYFFTADRAIAGITDDMVGRFLGWKLPADFGPDNSISFSPRSYQEHDSQYWPTGTNLLHAEQAREMLEHVVGGAPAMPGLESLTFCVLVLKNGAKVVGVNYGAIDPGQHCAERGRTEARNQAIDKVYELLGFRLRDEISRHA